MNVHTPLPKSALPVAAAFCTRIRYSMTSEDMSLSLYHKKRRKSVALFDNKTVEHVFNVSGYGNLLFSEPHEPCNKAVVEVGPVINTSLRKPPLYGSLELNTTLILAGFLG